MKKLIILIVMLVASTVANAQMFWNQAAKFEGGTNSYLTFRNSATIGVPGFFTIECWVYPMSSGASTRYLIFKQDGSSGATYYTGINSSNKLVVGTSPGINRITSKSTIPLNKWTHVAAVFESSFKIYLNGQLDTAGGPNNAHATLSTDSLFIGKHPSGAGFNGMMDNIRIWSSNRSQQQIFDNMRSSFVYAGPYAQLAFNITFQRPSSTGTVFNITDLTFQNLGVNNGVNPVDMTGKPSTYLTLNEALDLRESNSHASVPNNPAVDITGAMTVEAWIYLSSFTSGGAQYITRKGQGLSPNSGYRLLITGNQKLSFGINSLSHEGQYTVPLAKWTYVAFTLTGTGQAVLYANGVRQDSINISLIPSSNTDSLYIGSNGTIGELEGLIDEFRLTKAAKTGAQIREFMYKPIDGSNEPVEDNFCFSFDGTSFATTSTLQVFFLRGGARYSNPGSDNSIPVSPLHRADALNFSTGFYMKTTDRNIPALGSMVEDSITVSNGSAINDVNLFLSLTHDRPQDLSVTLVSPSGDSVNVLNLYVGLVSSYSSITTIFDDGADSSLINGTYIDLGRHIKPLNNLNAAFAGENAAGVWKLRIRDNINNAGGKLNAWGVQINNSTVGVQTVSNEIPSNYKLEQNYPNPFNPVTRINYELPISNYVRLYAYDVTGKLVKVLVNEKQNAGSYAATFDGSGLASGIYFYKLEAGSFKDVNKMILIK